MDHGPHPLQVQRYFTSFSVVGQKLDPSVAQAPNKDVDTDLSAEPRRHLEESLQKARHVLRRAGRVRAS